MRGAASYKEGVTPEPTDDRGAVYHEDGSRQEQWITKDPITGHVKIVVENYDANDQFTERYVVVTNRQGNLVRDFYVQPDTGSGIERYGYTEPPHGSRSFWRRSGETEWHHGRRPHSLGGDYPTDDAPEENPHYFLKLANGEYAMCYMVNPQAGLSYCTLMNRDQINIDSEMAPVIPATHLKINPRDLVVILDPDGTVVHDEVTLEGIRRRFVSPDPGGRPDPVGGV
jgi:hypothetical protein